MYAGEIADRLVTALDGDIDEATEAVELWGEDGGYRDSDWPVEVTNLLFRHVKNEAQQEDVLDHLRVLDSLS